jgi:hypothetical protein
MKFPVEAHFWLDELFYYININVQVQDLHIRSSNKERAAVINIAETQNLLNLSEGRQVGRHKQGWVAQL